MPRQEKIDAIEQFKDQVTSHSLAIATRFAGITAGQATALRKKLRDSGVQFKVYKNTLVARALSELDIEEATRFMTGPTAWAFAQDPVAPAKLLREYNKEVPALEMSGAILDGKVIDKAQLDELADMPPREVLLGRTVGVIAMPLRSLVGVLSAPMRDAVNVLEQIRKQKEQTAAA